MLIKLIRDVGRAAPRLFERNSHSDGISKSRCRRSCRYTAISPLDKQAVPLFLLVQVFHAYKKEIVSYPIP